MTDAQTWRGMVARYRKWEQRRDRAVNPDIRREMERAVARFYLDLSNNARAMVIEWGKKPDTKFLDNKNVQGDYVLTTALTSWGYSYKIKRKNEDPERVWFQRFEHEPWLDLGYPDASGNSFSDTPQPKRTFAETVAYNRASDLAHGERHGMQYGTLLPSQPRTGHVHFALTGIDPGNLAAALNGGVRAIQPKINAMKGVDPMLSSSNPDELEAAAAHAMATAARIRAFAALEPQDDDEPTISWRWSPDNEDNLNATYVAFKSDTGRWYTTGSPRFGAMAHGHTWRDLGEQRWAEPLTRGDFLIVTGWAKATEGSE